MLYFILFTMSVQKYKKTTISTNEMVVFIGLDTQLLLNLFWNCILVNHVVDGLSFYKAF